MDTSRLQREPDLTESRPEPSSIGEGTAENAPAWEMLTNGRYMPRRIRGSCQGRELG